MWTSLGRRASAVAARRPSRARRLLGYESGRPLVGMDAFPPGLGRLTNDLVVDRAEGCWIHTQDGRRVLDLTSGIGVTSLGHCHPAVVEAVREQAGKLLHGQLSCVTHQPVLDLVEGLRELTAGPMGLDSFAFANSGAEAVELAVRIAKHATGRPNVIVFQGGYHGRTIGAGSLTTAKTCYRAGYQPLLAGVFVAPYAYCHRCPAGGPASAGADCCGHPLAQLELLLKQQTAPEETAAILFEPVLGEGGYVVPPPSFTRGLREVADRTGALLIADEVQTGFGRTGTNFFVEQHGVRPDLLVMAKGIAAGMPLSAVAGRKETLDRCKPGSLGGTYGANAVACAAANAVLAEMKRGRVLDNVRARGDQMRAGLEALQDKYGRGAIADVRGAGLMLAVEFGPDAAAGTAAAVSRHAHQKEDMLVLTAGVYETLRLIPPLVIGEGETADALARLDRSIAAVLEQKQQQQ